GGPRGRLRPPGHVQALLRASHGEAARQHRGRLDCAGGAGGGEAPAGEAAAGRHRAVLRGRYGYRNLTGAGVPIDLVNYCAFSVERHGAPPRLRFRGSVVTRRTRLALLLGLMWLAAAAAALAAVVVLGTTVSGLSLAVLPLAAAFGGG